MSDTHETPAVRTISEDTFQQFKVIGSDYVAQKAEIAELKKKLAASDAAFKHLGSLTMQFTAAFGLNTPDGKQIRPEIIDGTENALPAILKQLSSIMGDAMSGSGKKRLEERFAFFQELPQVLEHYKTIS